MKEMIFIDTSGFVALNDQNDLDHEAAIAWVRSMLSETAGLCTSMQVISESATALKQKAGMEKAKKFLDFLKQPGIQILEDNREIQEEAWKMFEDRGKVKKAGFNDFWKVALMHYYGIMKVFTFNRQFDKLEVMRVPKR